MSAVSPAPAPDTTTDITDTTAADTADADVDAADAADTAPAAAQVQETIARMQEAYRDGDLDVLMNLFVGEPEGRSRGLLAREYADLFASSGARALRLHDLVWLHAENSVVGLGRFETSVTPRHGGQPRITRGGVRVELRLEHGEARILRMSHERQ